MRHLIEGLAIIGGPATGLAIAAIHEHWPKWRDNLLQRWPVKSRVKQAMHWPLVWRWAVAWGKTQPHNETGICLLCLANLREAEDAHQPKDSVDRTVVCGRCGLPKNHWPRRCPGAPRRKAGPVRRPLLTATRAFWE